MPGSVQVRLCGFHADVLGSSPGLGKVAVVASLSVLQEMKT